MNILVWLLIGVLAGWIAEKIMKSPMGIVANLVVGIVGALLGGFIFGLFGLDFDGFLGSLFTATIGAIVLLWIVNAVRKRT